jgi:hypothetical protein
MICFQFKNFPIQEKLKFDDNLNDNLFSAKIGLNSLISGVNRNPTK